jgi:hypothetical protein
MSESSAAYCSQSQQQLTTERVPCDLWLAGSPLCSVDMCIRASLLLVCAIALLASASAHAPARRFLTQQQDVNIANATGVSASSWFAQQRTGRFGIVGGCCQPAAKAFPMQ